MASEDGYQLFEQNDDKIKVSAKCGENIFNAYLILKYRNFNAESDLEWNENNHHNYTSNLKLSLMFVSYLVMILKYTALTLLIRVTMLSSDTSYKDWKTDKPSDKTYYVFPFFVLAQLNISADLKQDAIDNTIFQNWGIASSSFKIDHVWKFPHWIILKGYGKSMFELMGSIIYFITLSMYSTPENWEDILNVILNLLAYQFIMNADEIAYNWFAKARIETFVARTASKEIDIFDGVRWVDKDPSFTETRPLFMVGIFDLFFWCLLYQSLLSNNETMLIAWGVTYIVLTIYIGSVMLINKCRK